MSVSDSDQIARIADRRPPHCLHPTKCATLILNHWRARVENPVVKGICLSCSRDDAKRRSTAHHRELDFPTPHRSDKDGTYKVVIEVDGVKAEPRQMKPSDLGEFIRLNPSTRLYAWFVGGYNRHILLDQNIPDVVRNI